MSKQPDNKNERSILDKLLDQLDPLELKKTEERMLLASRIADQLERKRWNNKQFAASLNKEASVISKWLSGTHNFTHDTLVEICVALTIELIELLTPKPLRAVFRKNFFASSEPTNITNIYNAKTFPQVIPNLYDQCEDGWIGPVAPVTGMISPELNLFRPIFRRFSLIDPDSTGSLDMNHSLYTGFANTDDMIRYDQYFGRNKKERENKSNFYRSQKA